MKTWSYGINSLYKTASIDLRTGPWCLFALERTAEFCCDIIPSIPLPNAKKRLRDQEDIELNLMGDVATKLCYPTSEVRRLNLMPVRERFREGMERWGY